MTKPPANRVGRPLPLVLGTAQLGLDYGIANRSGKLSPEAGRALIRQAWNNGIRTFDTAQAYGQSEKILGNALQELGDGGRARIISKLSVPPRHLDNDNLQPLIDASLHRLGLPALYGLMFHDDTIITHWNPATERSLSRIVASGKVKHLGISCYQPRTAIQAARLSLFTMIQIPANILDRRFEESGFFQIAAEQAVQVYIRSVYLQGLLLMAPDDLPPRMQFALPAIRQFTALAKALRMDKDHLALGYARRKWADSRIVFGVDTTAQLYRNLKIFKTELPDDAFQTLENRLDTPDRLVVRPDLWPT